VGVFLHRPEANLQFAICNYRFAIFSLIILGFFASLARGEDWPQFGGNFSRHFASNEKGLPDWFEPGKKKSDGSGIEMATAKNDLLFVADITGRIHCLDADTGHFYWIHETKSDSIIRDRLSCGEFDYSRFQEKKKQRSKPEASSDPW
jgi:hypothetical protein